MSLSVAKTCRILVQTRMLKLVYLPVMFLPIRRQKSNNLKRTQSVLVDSRQHGIHEVDGIEPYADESIASSEWLRDYQSEQQQINEQLTELQGPLENEVPINAWYVFVYKTII